jgi:predicted transcriptional regulator
MPQIRCPNCGTTINLQNRKRIDFDLIIDTVKKGPKKFTELLKTTRLSRKTLSLRLKEMCESGVLVKREGEYELSTLPESSYEIGKSGNRFSRLFHDRRVRIGLALISLVVLSSASGYGLATYVERSRPKQTTSGPPILGNLTLALDVNDVKDLYAWQVVITYNSTELVVITTSPGDFLPSQFIARSILNVSKSLVENRTIESSGTLLLGGCLAGQVGGVNGTGRLAVITFGLLTDEYYQPKLVKKSQNFETFLLNSTLSDIPTDDETLTLYEIENH